MFTVDSLITFYVKLATDRYVIYAEMKHNLHLSENFEDIKRQSDVWHCNRVNNDLLNITHKTKGWAAQTPLDTQVNLRCSGRVGSFTTGTSCVTHMLLQSSIKVKDMIEITTNGPYSWSSVVLVVNICLAERLFGLFSDIIGIWINYF